MKRLYKLSLAMAFIGLLSGAALADQSAGVILTVGDSISSGEGVPKGKQDKRGYAAQLRRMLRGWIGLEYQGSRRRMALINIAVPGYRTGDVGQQLLDDALRQELATRDIRVVTLTVGGNDLRAVLNSGELNACFAPGSKVLCEAAAATAFGNIGARYRDIVANLRSLAPNADIALIDQYNPFRKEGCDPMGIAATADALLAAWNSSVVAPTAEAFGIHHVEIRQGFADAGQVYHSSIDGDCLHPSAFGHRYIARSVEKALLGY